MSHVVRLHASLFVLAMLLGSWTPAHAQTSTGTIRGTVTDETGQPLPGANVLAQSTSTGVQRGAATGPNGFYNISGLQPGTYEFAVSFISYRRETQTIRVQVGQTLTLDVQLQPEAVELDEVSVVASEPFEVETPEVANNVTTEQIENLPLNDRNFLDLATLAPGVIRTSSGSITSGALRADNVNVFIDGASYKNDVLQGGVAGQDASDGNPFPQSAVQEFRVISQQYKAEYEKASSAVITAVTKSGGNTWSGSAFTSFQDQALSSTDYFTERDPDLEEPDYSRYQVGIDAGGPIIPDRLSFYGAYEGNFQDRFATVDLAENIPSDLPAGDIDVSEAEGNYLTPFRSNLFFGKLTFYPDDKNFFEASASIRSDHEERGFGGVQTQDREETFSNDVYTFLAKHQHSFSQDLINEALVNYQRYRWNPRPTGRGVAINYPGLEIGPRTTEQDFIQDRVSFSNSLTWTVPNGFGSHVFKGGATVNYLEYSVDKRFGFIPQFTFDAFSDAFPRRAVYGTGDPNVSATNWQFGFFVQDDWSPLDRLTLNLGVRWDFETNMLNNDYETPQAVVDAILQTEAATGVEFVDEDAYFTDGDDRPIFLGAVQPRLGFSYDVFGDGNTAVFGGWGLYYDRNFFNSILDEQYRLGWTRYEFLFSEDGLPDENNNPTIAWEDRYFSREGLEAILASGQAPEPEVWLLRNDTRPPRSTQTSVGVRHTVGAYLLSLSYSRVRGYNDLGWYFANRTSEGFNNPDVPGFGTILLSTDEVRSWFDGVYVQAKRPIADGPWGAELSYTLSWAYREIEEFTDGFAYLRPEDFEKTPAANDERHRITASGTVRLPYGFRLSGLSTFSTGRPYNVFFGTSETVPFEVADRNNNGIVGDDYPPGEGRNSGRFDKEPFLFFDDVFAFRNIDLRLEKSFLFRESYRLGLIAEVFNVFDWDNFDGYEGNLNADATQAGIRFDFGDPTSVITDRLGGPRRFQFGARVAF